MEDWTDEPLSVDPYEGLDGTDGTGVDYSGSYVWYTGNGSGEEQEQAGIEQRQSIKEAMSCDGPPSADAVEYAEVVYSDHIDRAMEPYGPEPQEPILPDGAVPETRAAWQAEHAAWRKERLTWRIAFCRAVEDSWPAALEDAGTTIGEDFTTWVDPENV